MNVDPPAGTVPRSTGAVRMNEASGNVVVSSACRRMAPSRLLSSLVSWLTSAMISALARVVPLNVNEPVNAGVRPTAVLAPMVASSSCTR